MFPNKQTRRAGIFASSAAFPSLLREKFTRPFIKPYLCSRPAPCGEACRAAAGRMYIISFTYLFMQNNLHRGGDALVFRHFARKGWSLFSCLHREVRVGVLGAATLLSAAPRLAVSAAALRTADEGEGTALAADTLQLGEAAVSASRAPLAAGVAARQVVTLTRDDLAAAGVTTVNDVLKLTAGVDVRQRGGYGVQTDISIDGGTFDQITLLVNGVPVVNPQTGHNAADFPLNLSDIERVEIVEGAASRVMGSQAFSGAVNVVTRTKAAAGDRLRATVEGGSHGMVRGEARTAWSAGRGWTLSASGSGQRSDGAVDNGAFKGGKGFAYIGYDAADFRLDVQGGVTASDFGANTFYSARYPDQWEATRRYLVSARGETKGRVRVAAQVSWLRNADHYQLTRGSERGENFNRSDVYTAAANAWTDWAAGRTAAGAEVREETLLSGNLGRPVDESQYVGVPREPGKLYTRRDSRTNVSYFLEHNVVWRRFTLSAGVMAQRNTAAGGGFRFYPGIDVSFRPSGGWRVYASFNRALRLPSFTDLWYKSPTQEGNVGLRPEECSDVRLGADFTCLAASVRLKAHYRHGTHMIDWVMYDAADIYHATSFDLDNFGAGADATLRLDRLLGGRQPLVSLSVSYAWLWQHRLRGEDYFKSNYAMEYLRHKFTAKLSHRIYGPLTAEWTLSVQRREGAYLVYSGGAETGELRPYGTHALLDCKVKWTRRHYTLHVDMTNLTAHRYCDLANVVQPGFLVTAGASVSI